MHRLQLKTLVIIAIVVISLSVYFAMTVFILPEKFLAKEPLAPSPFLEAKLSSTEIDLGESFRLSTVSGNKGEYGDIHILSVSFPNLGEIGENVKILSYDFSNTPIYIEIGDEIGAKYSGGLETVTAQYPSIEAMSRPAYPETKYVMDIQITPEESGPFTMYVKSIDIPHVNSFSHYPMDGTLDYQEEYVLVYTVNVNP
jgi:hypothetical protein